MWPGRAKASHLECHLSEAEPVCGDCRNPPGGSAFFLDQNSELLRHSNVTTTMAHYVKEVPSETTRAMDKIDALFDNAPDGPPN
jgi:hypothetical protein